MNDPANSSFPTWLGKIIGEGVIQTIMQTVVEAYEQLAHSGTVKRSWDEQRITKHLYIEIDSFRTGYSEATRSLGFDPFHEFPVYPKKNTGRPPSIDFVFRDEFDDERYFAFECKKVDFRRGRLAGRYVRDGIIRFCRGTYSSSMSVGGMIAYSFNGDPSLEVNAINARICNTKGLGKGDELRLERIWSGFKGAYASLHARLFGGPFKIYHLILSF